MPHKDKEVRREYNRKYRTTHKRKPLTEKQKEAARTRAGAWHRANRERHRAYSRAWNAENESRRKASRKAYYQKNREEIIAQCRRYFEANREACIARVKTWQEANPERFASYGHARRVMAGGAILADVAIALLNERICFYCGVGIEYHEVPKTHPCKATIEHMLPVKRGGTNDPENLVAACRDCNNRKGKKTPEEFFRYLAEYRSVA